MQVLSLTCGEKGVLEHNSEVVAAVPPPLEATPPAKWDAKTLHSWLQNQKGLKEAAAGIPKGMTGIDYYHIWTLLPYMDIITICGQVPGSPRA
jgi:hypothetical protein